MTDPLTPEQDAALSAVMPEVVKAIASAVSSHTWKSKPIAEAILSLVRPTAPAEEMDVQYVSCSGHWHAFQRASDARLPFEGPSYASREDAERAVRECDVDDGLRAAIDRLRSALKEPTDD